MSINPLWMPLYIADYLLDTSHLCASEHGAYLLLMMHYWRNGGLPSDDRQLSMISRMTEKEWASSKKTIAAFFKAGWRHPRIDAELMRANNKIVSARASATMRWQSERTAKAMRTHMNGSAKRMKNGCETDAPIDAPIDANSQEKEL